MDGAGMMRLVLTALVTTLLAIPGPAAAHSTSGTIYYTRSVTSTANARSATYSFDGTSLTFGAPATFANIPGLPDGLVFDAGGTGFVGRGFKLYKVGSNGSLASANDAWGVTDHLSIDPGGQVLYGTAAIGDSHVAVYPLNPFGDATTRSVSGDEGVGISTIFFGPNGTAYYTTGAHNFAGGHFGVIDTSTMATSRKIQTLAGDHSGMYDPATGTLMVWGYETIEQIDPATFAVLSTRTIPGANLDQGSVDGQGHLFIADHASGNLVFVDYSATGRIGDPADIVLSKFLDSQLDDVAPLVGVGSPPAPPSTPAPPPPPTPTPTPSNPGATPPPSSSGSITVNGLEITVHYPGDCVPADGNLLVKVTSHARKGTGLPALKRVGFSIDGVTIDGRPSFVDAHKPFSMLLGVAGLPSGTYNLHAKLFLRRYQRNFKKQLNASFAIC
jgi:hypothetical protein